jgi:hypothetical protein
MNDIPNIPSNKINDLHDQIISHKIHDFTLPTNSLNMGGFKIINVSDPNNDQDVSTKKYVDTKFPNII